MRPAVPPRRRENCSEQPATRFDARPSECEWHAMTFPFRRALFGLDAERAHALTISMLSSWGRMGTPLAPGAKVSGRLGTRVAGIDFANPLGLAAGVDKDGRAIDGFFGFGFGAVEIGTLTPLPQAGNPKPRLFRLVEDRAVVNRMGFNNGGIRDALPRAQAAKRAGVLGINVGANKDTADRTRDYETGVALASAVADYVTINISSPNTPGLRDLQHGAALAELLAAADGARRTGGARTPLFLKVAPDLDRGTIDDIARAAIDHGVDAIIIGNTTITRPGLTSANGAETGGLSGAPLASLARERLADFVQATGRQMPLVAAGGIDSGAEAYTRIRAGASLVQLYSALVYEGPGLARRILHDLDALLARDGFTGVGEAVATG